MTTQPGIKFGNDGKALWKFRREEKSRQWDPLPGFPVEEPFASSDDALAYLDSPKLVCLRCGRRYSVLGKHLLNAHGMTSTEYKQFYFLPLSRGLSGQVARRRMSENGKKMWAAGSLSGRLNTGNPEKGAERSSVFKSRNCAAHGFDTVTGTIASRSRFK